MTRLLTCLPPSLASAGVEGLYRGLGMSLLVSVPNLAVGFSAYGTLKEHALSPAGSSWMKVEKTDPSLGTVTACLTPLASMAIGASSGVLSSMIVFPADVVRRRLQVRGLTTGTGQPRSLAAYEIRDIMRSDGLRGFYRGIAPELLKVTPMVAVTFSVYELLRGSLFDFPLARRDS